MTGKTYGQHAYRTALSYEAFGQLKRSKAARHTTTQCYSLRTKNTNAYSKSTYTVFFQNQKHPASESHQSSVYALLKTMILMFGQTIFKRNCRVFKRARTVIISMSTHPLIATGAAYGISISTNSSA